MVVFVVFEFFGTKLRDWLEWLSPKLSILCRVGCKILTQAISPCWRVQTCLPGKWNFIVQHLSRFVWMPPVTHRMSEWELNVWSPASLSLALAAPCSVQLFVAVKFKSALVLQVLYIAIWCTCMLRWRWLMRPILLMDMDHFIITMFLMERLLPLAW